MATFITEFTVRGIETSTPRAWDFDSVPTFFAEPSPFSIIKLAVRTFHVELFNQTLYVNQVDIRMISARLRRTPRAPLCVRKELFHLSHTNGRFHLTKEHERCLELALPGLVVPLDASQFGPLEKDEGLEIPGTGLGIQSISAIQGLLYLCCSLRSFLAQQSAGQRPV